ncbi:hypothetical protein TNCV_1809841 [Trichonephila clavipes]|nr:hypothetical protein TNCV_1809841 [Trichonephila clavipes]
MCAQHVEAPQLERAHHLTAEEFRQLLATLSHLVQGDPSVNKGLISSFLFLPARLVCFQIVNHPAYEMSSAQLQLCNGMILLQTAPDYLDTLTKK